VIVVAAFEAPAVVTGLDDVTVMGQPVEQRSGHLGVAEHTGPFAEREIGGDDDGGALVEPADEMEQQLAAGLRKGQVTEFVEDDEVHPGQMLGEPPLPSVAGLDLQAVDEVDHIVEAPAGTGSDAAPGDCDGQMGFAGAGAADQHDVALLGDEAAAIAGKQTRLTWLAPSRDESSPDAVFQSEESEIWMGAAEEQPRDLEIVAVQGGRERGLILHKLLEEVLTGETDDDAASLTARASSLICELERSPAADPAAGLSAEELAGCVVRALGLPEIAQVRPALLAEFSVYGGRADDGEETATAGIVDALTVAPDGCPTVVVDWKSDVRPTPETIEHYRAQVRTYLDMTGAMRGLIVLLTSGTVISVSPSAQTMAA
jgi:hypothetical protein